MYILARVNHDNSFDNEDYKILNIANDKCMSCEYK